VVIRLKVPIEMHYTVIPVGTSKVNSSRACVPGQRYSLTGLPSTYSLGFTSVLILRCLSNRFIGCCCCASLRSCEHPVATQ